MGDLTLGKRSGMRNHLLGAALAVAMAWSPWAIASAQTKKPSGAGTPSSSTPSSFDAHDLSGVWMQDRPHLNTANAQYWIYELTLEEPPMTAWGKAQYDASKSSFGTRSYPLAET